MLDLEFMSLAKDAAIASIGAVRFDLTDGTLGDSFYRVVNLKSSQRAGGRIDADTVMWWLSQNESARKGLYGDDSILIETALKEFSNWVRERPLEGMWGNGADCDNVILEGAYLRLGWTPPWNYRENRCYRTIKALCQEVSPDEFTGTQHNALSDAEHQARHLCKIIKKAERSK